MLGAHTIATPWFTAPLAFDSSWASIRYIVNLAWGYHTVPDRWEAWLRAWPKDMILINSPSLLLWNTRKTYLKELEKAGIPIVPTLYVEEIDEKTLVDAAAHFATADLIVKPQISACSFNTLHVLVGSLDFASSPRSLSVTAAVDELTRLGIAHSAMMIQPFMSNIIREVNRHKKEKMTLLLQHRHRRHLFIISFLVGICSITACIRLWLYQDISLIQNDIYSTTNFPQVRRNITERRFISLAVESLIQEIKRNIRNKELAWLFENCFPNTLDTTVEFDIKGAAQNHPDTYVITGDIDAMWLRDSSAQIHPYLPLMKYDKKLRQLIEGVLLRQFICIQRDPYANAHYKDLHRISEWKYKDETEMRDGVHERKWELDSLCYVLRLIYSYWEEVNHDLTFFHDYKEEFKKTIRIILQTMKEQQRYNGSGSYTYQREGAPPDPRGHHAKPNGLIYSYFRPSDDLQTYPYLIPSQFFAHHSLKLLLELVKNINWTDDFSNDILSLISHLRNILFDDNIKNNIETLITFQHKKYGLIYSYEINGVGDRNLMDDANIPSLLSLPYLCPNDISINDSIYQNTRKFVLSKDNPWFFNGSVLEGIGGPHIGYAMVWPLAIIMRGLTTNDDNEIRLCLNMLQRSHANTGFMHESIRVDNPMKFTRSWFAWANSLFGEFIWKLYREKKYLLDEIHTY
ncbi:unnamed protein product [Rotaria sordida]|uniref:Uncharacterized protein n=2 Tax=Rotaria sordida TaxID=392033 RepID=A0A814F2C2_9BILA|nr:unnamed protein product [Rotaria sordida]